MAKLILTENAVKRALRRINESNYGDDIRTDFINWAMNEAYKERGLGGPIDAVALMYEYCAEDNDFSLYQVVEAYKESRGIKTEPDSQEDIWISEEIRRAINSWWYYNGDSMTDNQEEEEMSVLKETIKGMIRESINNIMGLQQFPSEGGDMMEKHTKKSKHSPHNQHYKTNPKTQRQARATKRAIVIHWLKDPKNAVNCAEIMRQLWNPSPEEEDTKRGEFYKKRDGAINKDSGARYSFTDEEINALYRIKSHHE